MVTLLFLETMANHNKVQAAVKEYLEAKFAKHTFTQNAGDAPLLCRVWGIKPAMWLRVVKPELHRITADHMYYIDVGAGKRNTADIVFSICPLPTDPLLRVSPEPPLCAEELRVLRVLIERERNK